MKALLYSSLRILAPYALAATAGMISERSGVINFALEGIMLCCALAAASVALTTGSLWIGVGAALLCGVVVSLGYYALTAYRRVDQVLLGIAVNLAALGGTRFLLKLGFDSSSNSPRVEADALVAPLVPLALVLAWVLLTKTRLGVRLIAAGDAPDALRAQNISVRKTRVLALSVSGALLGLAGAFMVAQQHQFTDEMTAGRGYIAVAAVVLGGWRFWPVLLACVLFSVAEAVELAFQSFAIIPAQIVQMLPYVVCLVALLFRRSTFRAPHALGQ